jgi:hypothetical protein
LQSSTYLAEVLHGFPQLLQADAVIVPSNKPPFQIPIAIHNDLSISFYTIQTKLIGASSNVPDLHSLVYGSNLGWDTDYPD